MTTVKCPFMVHSTHVLPDGSIINCDYGVDENGIYEYHIDLGELIQFIIKNMGLNHL